MRANSILFPFGGLMFVIPIIIFLGCQTETKQPEPVNASQIKKQLLNANQELVQLEQMDIENYVKRHQWDMQKTGSGLRYSVYQKGHGIQVEKNKVVKFNYQTELITGTVCYSSEESGPKQFLVGKGGVEAGLEEAVLHLREGDRAKIILPSHLAFGLLGDDDCIPRKAVVIYDVEILKVLNPKNLN